MNRKRVCQYCQEAFDLASTGRPPKYCSATCRKSAWEKRRLEEAVAVAKAQAVAAERRRVARLANRGNETPPTPDIRGNETPPQARRPEGDFLLAPPAPSAAPRELPPALPPRARRRRSNMTASAMPLPLPEGEPDGQPRRDLHG